ncbi:hypothetical protein [Brevundimonas sp. Root1279]|uniref:hypothetical protein n=1 Tax=Brevundimonas sp. Root1279 TaxID=1736443 RepID=UPI0007014441|nr:hypothetical protein [Brevundimonas sp. Root1279]KQW79732.1 hypothetical protein ASC65_14385 [Brevundimonas sp. Root1279]
MNRNDIVDTELHYARLMRREAKSREKRYPAVAEQLHRFADAALSRVEAIKCGPLFDQEKAA